MPEDNHRSIEVIEFNWPLFVYQWRARGKGEYLFTIAVWKGTALLPICHLQPLQTALDALNQALITAGRSQSLSTTSAVSDRTA